MAILPTDIIILFTNYDIITYFLNLASCSEYFISIKHRILETFDINKKSNIGAIVVMVVPVQSVPIISKAVSLSPAQSNEVCSIQHYMYVIKFVSDL